MTGIYRPVWYGPNAQMPALQRTFREVGVTYDWSVPATTPATQSVGNPEGYGDVQMAGGAAAIIGAIGDAVVTFFQMEAEKEKAGIQEDAMKHASKMAAINARRAEAEAAQIIDDSHTEIGRLTMQAGADKSARRASLSARGVRLGVGSTAEIQASGDIIKEMDRTAISVNAVRAANGRMRAATNYQNESTFRAVDAQTARRNAPNPWIGLTTSLLTDAGDMASQWAHDNINPGTR